MELRLYATDEIMNRALQCGLSRRLSKNSFNIGNDEKCFRKGHKYITTLNEIIWSRAFDVVEGPILEAIEMLLQTITK